MKQQDISSLFQHALPSARLGKQLASLEAFYLATNHKTSIVKEYAIIVVTNVGGGGSNSINQRILLGMKHRGFGKDMYNSFAGKKTAQETPADCACRELEEEAGIAIPEPVMKEGHVGTMHYTFADEAFEMIMHVFHIDITISEATTKEIDLTTDTTSTDRIPTEQPSSLPMDPNCIRGCDEITPEWIDNWFDHLPLHNMFADDSLWLTRLLLAVSKGERLRIDGWFHFLAGGQAVNSIRHYYMNIRPKVADYQNQTTLKNGSDTSVAATSTTTPTTTHINNDNHTFSLEKRLFHALKSNKIQNPSTKELNEGWAFCKAVRNMYGHHHTFDVIIDVAGGHGALAALLLVMTSATRAVVIDPAQVGKGGVERAWRKDFLLSKQLDFRYEDLRTGLPAELKRTLQTVPRERVLVVACHACQHLSDEVLEIVCCQFAGVHAAVMPCCQKDTSPGSSWKSSSKNLQVPIEKVMDFLLAGKVMSWQVGKGVTVGTNESDNEPINYSYDVRMKVIDAKITPQNRIIFCKAIKQRQDGNNSGVAAAHQRLATVYSRAHAPQTGRQQPTHGIRGGRKDNHPPSIAPSQLLSLSNYQIGGLCLLVGLTSGFWLASNVGRVKR